MLFSNSVELLALKPQRIEGVQKVSGHNQRGKHGEHDTQRQRLGEALHAPRTQYQQDCCRDQGCDIAVDNGGKRLVKARLHRIADGLARCKLLPDTGENNYIGIHRHAYGQNDARNAGQGQSHVKAVQKQHHQRHIHQQADGRRHAGQQIHRDHENNHDKQADGPRLQARVDSLNPQLGSHHLGMQLLQLQPQAADADGGRKALRSLEGLHGGNLCAAVRDDRFYIGSADDCAIIIDSQSLSLVKGPLGGLGELFLSLVGHGQIHRVHRSQLVVYGACTGILHIRALQHDGTVL